MIITILPRIPFTFSLSLSLSLYIYIYIYISKSKVNDCSRGWAEGSLFNCFYTKVYIYMCVCVCVCVCVWWTNNFDAMNIHTSFTQSFTFFFHFFFRAFSLSLISLSSFFLSFFLFAFVLLFPTLTSNAHDPGARTNTNQSIYTPVRWTPLYLSIKVMAISLGKAGLPRWLRRKKKPKVFTGSGKRYKDTKEERQTKKLPSDANNRDSLYKMIVLHER